MKQLNPFLKSFTFYSLASVPVIIGFMFGLAAGLLTRLGKLTWAAILEGFSIGSRI
jgi:hypothetical protein